MKWSKPDDQGIAVAKYDKTGSNKDMPSGKASNETSKDADTWRGIKKVKEEMFQEESRKPNRIKRAEIIDDGTNGRSKAKA